MPGILVDYARTSTWTGRAGPRPQGRRLRGNLLGAGVRCGAARSSQAEGLQRKEIARRTGIGVASVYRVLADAKKLDAGRTIQV